MRARGKIAIVPFVLLTALTLSSAVDAQAVNEKLRSELLAMAVRDQDARNSCSTTDGNELVRCLAATDGPNVKRIREIIYSTGFPTSKDVGIDGVKAFFLILQHSESVELRLKCKKGIERAFKDKVLSVSEYTVFVDRLLVKQGKPQIYGSNFDLENGKLVMSRTKDVKNLDKRRIAIGLPPIEEYVKMLKDAYQMEIIVPRYDK